LDGRTDVAFEERFRPRKNLLCDQRRSLLKKWPNLLSLRLTDTHGARPSL